MGRGGTWVTGFAVLVALLSLLPIGFVIGVSWQVGWEQIQALVLRPRVGELLINTVLLVLLTLPLCILLGTALAWLTERSDMFGGVLPDRIFVFRNPLLDYCDDAAQLEEEVRITVVHEVAHHFGIDDDRLHELGWA